MLRLKSLRIERNIDQKVLSLDLAVSQPTISDWENERKIPSVENLKKIAGYFNVSIDYLLGLTDQKEKPTPEDGDGLNEVEFRLVALHRSLNLEGQEKLLDYADDLVASGKYIKSSPPGLGKEA